jgi:hypothetical protein
MSTEEDIRLPIKIYYGIMRWIDANLEAFHNHKMGAVVAGSRKGNPAWQAQIFPAFLEQYAKTAGFDLQELLSVLRDRGLLLSRSDRLAKKVTINGVSKLAYCLILMDWSTREDPRGWLYHMRRQRDSSKWVRKEDVVASRKER